jgi:hypothetical protein
VYRPLRLLCDSFENLYHEKSSLDGPPSLIPRDSRVVGFRFRLSVLVSPCATDDTVEPDADGGVRTPLFALAFPVVLAHFDPLQDR